MPEECNKIKERSIACSHIWHFVLTKCLYTHQIGAKRDTMAHGLIIAHFSLIDVYSYKFDLKTDVFLHDDLISNFIN